MWTNTESHLSVHRLWKLVDYLLKVLGTTGRKRYDVVHRPGHKPGGYPVDSRWTTVDNPVRLDSLWTGEGFRPLVSHL